MPMYQMNCDFFTVEFPNAPDQKFPDVLTEIMTRHTEPRGRDFDKNGDTLRLTKWDVIPPQTYHKGLMIRMRNNSAIRKASLDTDNLDFVELLRDERICEIMCFAYFQETSTLAVHRNKFAGSPYWLEDYVGDKSGMRPELQIIIDSNAWSRLDSMGVVKKVDVALSIPQNIGALDAGDQSVSAMIELANSQRGNRLSFEISAGRQKDGLKSTIKELLRRVSRVSGNVSVDKLTARGTDDDGTHTLDLLSERVKGSEAISCAGAEITVEEIWISLYDAYYKVRNEIRRQAIL